MPACTEETPRETSPASASLAAVTHPACCKCEWGAVPGTDQAPHKCRSQRLITSKGPVPEHLLPPRGHEAEPQHQREFQREVSVGRCHIRGWGCLAGSPLLE